jgi:hypothetical protein
MPEPIPEEKLSDLFSLRRSCVLYRDEADDVTVYREWQAKIENIDSKLRESGVMQ